MNPILKKSDILLANKSLNSSLFHQEKTKIITIIIINTIFFLLSCGLTITGIIFNIPLMSIGWLFTILIILISTIILLKNVPTSFMNSFCLIQKSYKEDVFKELVSSINEKSSLNEVQAVLEKIKKKTLTNSKEIDSFVLNNKFEKDSSTTTLTLAYKNGCLILPKEKSLSTAIVNLLPNLSSTENNLIYLQVTNRSWKSSLFSPSSKNKFISSGYWEYSSEFLQKSFPKTKLLIQTKNINARQKIQSFIKTLKNIYLNIFICCEQEHIKHLQLPFLQFAKCSRSSLLIVCNQIALLDIIYHFNFKFLKKITLIKENKCSSLLSILLESKSSLNNQNINK